MNVFSLLTFMAFGVSILLGICARRLDPRSRTIPVIALTAHAMAGDREQAIAAGADDTKPVDLPRLRAKMEALLARGQV